MSKFTDNFGMDVVCASFVEKAEAMIVMEAFARAGRHSPNKATDTPKEGHEAGWVTGGPLILGGATQHT